jgi:hypothetical protein
MLLVKGVTYVYCCVGFDVLLPVVIKSSLSTNKQIDSVALVRKRTITTERPLLVGEVSANFCG